MSRGFRSKEDESPALNFYLLLRIVTNRVRSSGDSAHLCWKLCLCGVSMDSLETGQFGYLDT